VSAYAHRASYFVRGYPLFCMRYWVSTAVSRYCAIAGRFTFCSNEEGCLTFLTRPSRSMIQLFRSVLTWYKHRGLGRYTGSTAIFAISICMVLNVGLVFALLSTFTSVNYLKLHGAPMVPVPLCAAFWFANSVVMRPLVTRWESEGSPEVSTAPAVVYFAASFLSLIAGVALLVVVRG
jgi:hypothetical protein